MAKQFYAADFETTTKEDDCRVWAWAICNIDTPYDLSYGNDMESFIQHIAKIEGRIYFHNLKFDGRFIIDWLLRNGYEWKQKPDEANTFSTLISNMGVFYTISIRFPENKGGISNKVDIYDSLKIMPFSIDSMPKTFGFEERKLSIDYRAEREVGHILTQQEKDYVSNDVIILAKALKFMFSEGQKKMTTGSNALADYRKRITAKQYERLFPELDLITDSDIRKSFKGGWAYLNPRYKNLVVGEGCVYDVNSMYPGVLKYKLLPKGEPVYFGGKYEPNAIYPLYVANILCEFKIKQGHYPSIQIKGAPMRYLENEYLEYSNGPVWLTLTNIDLELMFDQYDVYVHEYNGGYMFQGKHGMFDDYIDYWYERKTSSRNEGNRGIEKISKLMLNSLYGKFGTRKTTTMYIPFLDREKNIVRYYESQPEPVKKGYIPVATFCTSYARDIIIRGAQACGDRFIYADTDSLHVLGTEPIQGLDVDANRLGAFKLESMFKRAKFIRQKTYLEVYDTVTGEEKMDIKCAGLPDKIKARLAEGDFYEGAEYSGNLKAKTVPGGVILADVTYKIKKA